MFKFLAPIAFSAVMAAPEEDRFTSLPGMEPYETPFDMFSGYVPAGENNYHYMFVQSQRDPVNDPVVIWFNGGPGCSSVLGFAQEIGPWAMEDDEDHFHKNEQSWNKFANLIFIESPAGVGYSHCKTTESCIWNDDNSAVDNYNVILQLLRDKFPEYSTNDLYISGESYAGIYVPYVFRHLHEHNEKVDNGFKFNLKGWMVGNGVTNWKYDGVPAFIEMGFWHGLYDQDLYKELMDCDLSYFDFRTESISDHCMNLVMAWMNDTDHIFIYDIYKVMIMPEERN